MGAYSDSRGALMIRKEVAAYIKNRDGLKEDPNPDHIFLTGACSMLHACKLAAGASR